MADTKGEYIAKKLATKQIYYYQDTTLKIDQISREVYKNKDKVVHYPRGFEKEPKYRTIKKFIYRGFKGNLPVGIVKAVNLGYGFTKTLKPFAYFINDSFDIEEVIVEKQGRVEIDIERKKLYLNEISLITLNTAFRDLFGKQREETRFTLNLNLHKIFPGQIAKPEKTYLENALATSLAAWGNSIDEFSDRDKEAIKELFDKLSLNTDFLSSTSLAKTKEIVDSKYIQQTLKTLEELMALKVDGDSLEAKWQIFLRDNNWVFSSIFAQPVILFKREAYVGGKNIDNQNGKFNDFLIQSDLSNNVSFLEIKTHKTKLIENSPYRGQDVYSATKELTGCIVQVLNQRDNFQKEFYSLKVKSRGAFETFNSKCLVIIGSIADLDENQKNSFELYRTNSKDVEILTFDELHAKIKALQTVVNS